MGDAWTGGNRGGQAWGAVPPRDPGWEAIDKILGDKTLPRWNLERARFEPSWKESDIDLANLIIKNTYEELKMSKEKHDLYKRQRKAMGHPNPWDGTLNLGWLERTNIWERPSKARAVISLVIKLVGLQLQEKKNDQTIDRAAAATAVHTALLIVAS